MAETVAKTTRSRKSQTTPEALCSVNIRFQIPGYADFGQATGRGDTPEQAARNLTETIAATKAALAPAPAPQTELLSAPRTREQILAGLLTCGMQKAVAKGDMGLVERLAKAAALVLSASVEPTDRADCTAVRSACHAETWYEVETSTGKHTCSCPDYQHHRDEAKRYCCKHIAAVMMHQRIAAEVNGN